MKIISNHKGKTLISEFLEDINFEELGRISQAQCYIFDKDDNICLVDCAHDEKWTIPGGQLEDYDENIEAALYREIQEEADVKIEKPIRIGSVKVTVEESGDVFYQAKFAAKLKTLLPQTIDPAYNKIPKRKCIPHQKYRGGNKSRNYWVTKALETLKKVDLKQ